LRLRIDWSPKVFIINTLQLKYSFETVYAPCMDKPRLWPGFVWFDLRIQYSGLGGTSTPRESVGLERVLVDWGLTVMLPIGLEQPHLRTSYAIEKEVVGHFEFLL
jgi:hypothetical protein